MKQDHSFSEFQKVLRTFLTEALDAKDGDRNMALTNSPSGVEKLCTHLSAIDSGTSGKSVEFEFRQMSKELSCFINTKLSHALLSHYKDSQFWVVYRARQSGGKWRGFYESVSVTEAQEILGHRLVIFHNGHSWAYLSDDGATVCVSRDIADIVGA